MSTGETLPEKTENCVEAEIVYNGSGDRKGAYDGRQRAEYAPPPQAPGLFTRLKGILAGGLALLGAALFIIGALLTSTVLGAIIGIPLMLAGAVVFFLLFKLLSAGSKNFVVFRRF